MIEAVVIDVKETKTTFGLLNSDGTCGSGSCKGCQCSRAIKKISLPSDSCPKLKKGTRVELHRSPLFLLHFVLMICLPLAVLAIVRILPVWESTLSIQALNGISLGSGLGTFLLMVMLIKVFGKKETLKVYPIQDNPVT